MKSWLGTKGDEDSREMGGSPNANGKEKAVVAEKEMK